MGRFNFSGHHHEPPKRGCDSLHPLHPSGSTTYAKIPPRITTFVKTARSVCGSFAKVHLSGTRRCGNHRRGARQNGAVFSDRMQHWQSKQKTNRGEVEGDALRKTKAPRHQIMQLETRAEMIRLARWLVSAVRNLNPALSFVYNGVVSFWLKTNNKTNNTTESVRSALRLIKTVLGRCN